MSAQTTNKPAGHRHAGHGHHGAGGWIFSILATLIFLALIVALAALAGTFMAINFHLANGGNHPWLIPKDWFDETIDVDSVLVMIQLGFTVFCGYLIAKIRQQHRVAVPRPKTPPRHGALPAAS